MDPLQNNNNLQQHQVEQSSVLYNNHCNYTDNIPVMENMENNNTIPSTYTYTPSNYEQQQFNNEHSSTTSQTNYSEISFDIPGFRIIITCIPTSSTFENSDNLDVQNQENYTSNIVANNLQTQLQQVQQVQQVYTSSDIVADNFDNSQVQFQQDYNSFNDFSG